MQMANVPPQRMVTTPGRPRPKPAPRVTSEPLIGVSPETLERYHARILDPTTATRLTGQPTLRSTVYIGDRLLVTGDVDREALDKAAATFNLRVEFEDPNLALRAREIVKDI